MKKLLLIVLCLTSSLQAYNVGFLVVATGKYINFIPPLLESARKYFCVDQKVTYFVFTDGDLPEKPDDVVILPWKKMGWPYDTMLRFLAYFKNFEQLKGMDYLFACDADMLFVDYVGSEILSELVAAQHPGYIGRRGTYETNVRSTAYVAPYEGTNYFAGGFYGGTLNNVFNLLYETLTHIDADLKNNYIAIWHDESHLNRYFIDHRPTLILPAPYLARPFDHPQKLVALDKNHAAFRKAMQ